MVWRRRSLTSEERQKLKDAHDRAGLDPSVFGLFFSPIAMWITWDLTKDMRVVYALGRWTFLASSMLLIVSAVRLTSLMSKLRPVRQEHAVGVDGPYARTRKTYRVTYDFDRFTAEQYEAYRLLRFWGLLFSGAFLVQVGYAATLAFISFWSQL